MTALTIAEPHWREYNSPTILSGDDPPEREWVGAYPYVDPGTGSYGRFVMGELFYYCGARFEPRTTSATRMTVSVTARVVDVVNPLVNLEVQVGDRFDGTGFMFLSTPIATDGSWLTHSWTFPDETPAAGTFNPSELATLAGSGDLLCEVLCASLVPGTVWEVAWVSISFDDEVFIPLRQFHRDDGYGTTPPRAFGGASRIRTGRAYGYD